MELPQTPVYVYHEIPELSLLPVALYRHPRAPRRCDPGCAQPLSTVHTPLGAVHTAVHARVIVQVTRGVSGPPAPDERPPGREPMALTHGCHPLVGCHRDTHG